MNGAENVHLTFNEAAKAYGVPSKTIRTWRERGLIVPAGRNHAGHLVFREDDLLRTERATRKQDPAQRRARRLAEEASREA